MARRDESTRARNESSASINLMSSNNPALTTQQCSAVRQRFSLNSAPDVRTFSKPPWASQAAVAEGYVSNALRQEPSRSQVEAQMIRLLHDIAGILPASVTPAATIENELQLQSVQFVELQVALEDEYDIELDPIQIVEKHDHSTVIFATRRDGK